CNPNSVDGDTEATRLVLSAVLPSAFQIDYEGSSVYDSALIVSAELQSDNPQTVVYTINPKAVWSDGVPITASDFIYAWHEQRALQPGQPGDSVVSTAGYDDIFSMTPSHRGRMLTVVFSTPYGDWQRLFNDLLPAHVLAKKGWDPHCTTVDPAIDLSGGPFEIGSVAPDSVVLVRNPRWWGSPAKADRIVIRFATSSTQLSTWLARGVVDVVAPSYFDPAFLAAVSSIQSTKSSVGISDTFLEMEFSMDGALTSQTAIRQGIAYGIDRQELVDKVVGSLDAAIAPSSSHLYSQAQSAYPSSPVPVPANATTTPTSTTTTTTVPQSTTTTTPITSKTFPLTADPLAQARALTSAGYSRNLYGTWIGPSNHPLSIRLGFDGSDGWAAQTADLVAAQLDAEGISVDAVEEPDAAATGEALSQATTDIAILPLPATPYVSQTASWYTPLLDQPGQAGDRDSSGYVSTYVDDLFQSASTDLDPALAAPTYAEIDQRLWTDMVALPLFAEPDALAFSDYVTGMALGPYRSGLLSSVLDWARLVREPTSYRGTPRLRA
ncbi:MAG: ABC transporter substrate-binding protein, partial [Acidimicrobiales bacterium]